jgi:TonB family protein
LDEGQHKSQFSNDSTETGARSKRARSHAAWFAVSIAAHAVAIAAIVYFAPPLSKPHGDWVLAYLVEVGDGSSSGRSIRAGAGATLPMPIRSETGPLLIPARRSSHKLLHGSMRVSRTHHEYEVKAPDAEVASLASGSPAISAPAADSHGLQSNSGSGSSNAEASTGAHGDSGMESRSIDGVGDGDGSSIAHADYGKNPPPVYPAIARRRDQQGTVTIRVLVGNDGSVERAEIAESSGFDALDDAALETVRRRWRFVPARRGGTPVESWVLAPIRFALTEANAAR